MGMAMHPADWLTQGKQGGYQSDEVPDNWVEKRKGILRPFDIPLNEASREGHSPRTVNSPTAPLRKKRAIQKQYPIPNPTW